MKKKYESECKELKIWERNGGYYYLRYANRMFNVNDFVPRPEQSSMIDEILDFYTKNKYCVALIHDPKGCGKSMIPIILGKAITKKDQEANFCDTFMPTDPGDQFSNLYNQIEQIKRIYSFYLFN
jgi:hypothetical protein